MANGKGKGKGKTKGGRGQNTPALSPEDAKLLEYAKKLTEGADFEQHLKEFEEMFEEDIENQLKQKREYAETALDEELQQKRDDFEDVLKEEHRELVDAVEDLKIQKQSIEIGVSELEKDLEDKQKELEAAENHRKEVVEGAQSEAAGIIATAENLAEETENKANEKATEITEIAEKKAEAIIQEAKERAENQNRELLESIQKQKKEIEDREEAADDKALELEIREHTLEKKEKRVKKKEAIYDTANPEELATLKKQLELSTQELDRVRDDYEEIRRECNKYRQAKMNAAGISPEELQETNDRLVAQIEVLENKCNRYTEYELLEMERALKKESEYLATISNQNREIAERKAEVQRLNNGILEYEQLKGQLDLLRTLNDHLRSELDNTKKMLESSVGEICPALTAIDIQQGDEASEEYALYEERLEKKADGRKLSLSKIVTHVRDFASCQDNPLFYSDRDWRAFIAGMASSPIAILQGMSGTGKTSLPKIFAKAIMGEINIVPVESSWRDRNELLGYYNDFSKKFTAKEFTCDLYRAGCNHYTETPYFIVLDEMNLSRVEYYFADFLSILENEKKDWRVKLVDTDLRQLPTEITPEVRKALQNEKSEEIKELIQLVDRLYPNLVMDEEEQVQISANEKMRLIAYLSSKKFKNKSKTHFLVGGPQHLIDGNSIRIPDNVWFIGTANRDESTFEITDKVYDRAQVLNFNDRASGKRISETIDSMYVTKTQLFSLFSKAKYENPSEFSAETNPLLKKIEEILKANFRISFGNRIQDQMDTFVPVYVTAGGGTKKSKPEELKRLENEAVDYQLTNKVLRKLEYIELGSSSNKDAADKLRKIFEQEHLDLAKSFMDWKLRGED